MIYMCVWGGVFLFSCDLLLLRGSRWCPLSTTTRRIDGAWKTFFIVARLLVQKAKRDEPVKATRDCSRHLGPLYAMRPTKEPVFTLLKNRIPSPPSGMNEPTVPPRYGATKAFLSNLAVSLSVEVRAKGIDMLSVHPSPVQSQFYSNLDHTIELMDKAKEQAVAPNTLPRSIFKCIGRVVWRDLGGMAIGVRVGTKMLSYNFLGTAFAVLGPYLPDYKKNDAGR